MITVPTEAPAWQRARAGQPGTSHDAADRPRPTILAAVGDLLRSAGPRGMTDDELAEALTHLTTRRHSVATRRDAWVTAGHVARTDRTRANELGNACTVWVWVTDTPDPTKMAGSRGQRGAGHTTAVDRSTVDVPLLASPNAAHCPICGTIEGQPHWAGCTGGTDDLVRALADTARHQMPRRSPAVADDTGHGLFDVDVYRR